jgi:hypothetical protein
MAGSIAITTNSTAKVIPTAPSVSVQLTTKGARGDAGGITRRIANVALGGHRVVKGLASGNAAYASSDVSGDNALILGITEHAADADAEVSVRYQGDMEEGSWNWSPGPVFCGVNGVLTQTPPSTGFVCQVGVSDKPTRINVNIGPALVLG